MSKPLIILPDGMYELEPVILTTMPEQYVLRNIDTGKVAYLTRAELASYQSISLDEVLLRNSPRYLDREDEELAHQRRLSKFYDLLFQVTAFIGLILVVSISLAICMKLVS